MANIQLASEEWVTGFIDQSKWEKVSLATTIHPRWIDSQNIDIYGTDEYGLDLIPGGTRNGITGLFTATALNAGVGGISAIWTSTQTPGFAGYTSINLYAGYPTLYVTDNKHPNNGQTLRLVRDCTISELLLHDGKYTDKYTDYDTNIYNTCKIGTQIWTTSNLKVTHYNDGSLIPNNLTNDQWITDISGATCLIPYIDELTTDELIVSTYGILYNAYAISNVKGIVDSVNGWRIPTKDDALTLQTYVSLNGNILKSTRQINTQYYVHFKPKYSKRIDYSIIDNLPISLSLSGGTLTGNLTGLTFYGSGAGLNNIPTSGIIGISSIGSAISVIYSELVSLVNTSGLTIGKTYLITDYQTRHIIPNTSIINLGTIEPLFVNASGNNTLSPICYSKSYSKDIIYYDLNNRQDLVPGCNKGYIYRRIDTLQNNDIPFDFRNVKFRRWQLNVTNIWNSGTTYNKSSVVLYSGTTQIYICLYNNVINSNPSTDFNAWKLFDWNNLSYVSTAQSSWEIGISIPCSTGYTDYYMWSNWNNYSSSMSNKIELNIAYGNILNSSNTVIFSYGFMNNYIGSNFSSNSIGDSFSDNKIGKDFKNNSIGSMFVSNSISNNFNFNNISESFTDNIIENYFSYNTISKNTTYNLFGTYFSYNNIAAGFTGNKIGYNSRYNSIGRNSAYNVIEGNFSSNTVDYGLSSNVIDYGINTNTIGYNFSENNISSYFSANIIGNNFNRNNISHYCQSNTISDNFSYNNIGSKFSSNIIGSSFQMNNVSDSFGGLDFTSATHVYLAYTTELFTNSSYQQKLIFDKITIVNANA